MDNYIKESFIGKYYQNNAYSKDDKVEERNPYLIEDDGKMSGFYFYDREVWTGDNWCISLSNFSGNVWFGKIYTYDELLNIYKSLSLKDRLIELRRAFNYLPTYDSILQYMRDNNLSVICIDRFHNFHRLQNGDITYDELMAQRADSLENIRIMHKFKG